MNPVKNLQSKVQINVFVILPNYIGDVLMATPAVRLLRKIEPSSRITALVSRRAYDIIKNNPYIDEIIVRENKPDFFARFDVIKKVRKSSKGKFDRAILFRDTFFNNLTALVSGSKRITKVKDAAWLSYKELCVDAVERAFDYNAEPKDYSMDLVTSAGDAAAVEKFLLENNCNRFVALNPVATRPSKIWKMSNYNILIDSMFIKYGLKTVLIGSAGDANMCASIYNDCLHKPLVAAGKFSLTETAEVIKKSEVFISPDTGPLHMSIALGKKTIGLFGSTDPEKYGPYPETAKMIYHKVACSPCYKNICTLGKDKNYCMSQISVEEVLEQIEKFIA